MARNESGASRSKESKVDSTSCGVLYPRVSQFSLWFFPRKVSGYLCSDQFNAYFDGYLRKFPLRETKIDTKWCLVTSFLFSFLLFSCVCRYFRNWQSNTHSAGLWAKRQVQIQRTSLKGTGIIDQQRKHSERKRSNKNWWLIKRNSSVLSAVIPYFKCIRVTSTVRPGGNM